MSTASGESNWGASVRLLQSEGGRAGATAPPHRRAPASPSSLPSVAGQALHFSSPEPVPPPAPVCSQPLYQGEALLNVTYPLGQGEKPLKMTAVRTPAPPTHANTQAYTQSILHTHEPTCTYTHAHSHTCMHTGIFVQRFIQAS